jgi:uncharacterized protein YciI
MTLGPFDQPCCTLAIGPHGGIVSAAAHRYERRMLFMILFEDDPRRFDLRGKHMQAHLDFLAERGERILGAGSLRDAPGGTPSGGLWIVDVADRAEAEAIYRDDPFWTCGLRRSVQVKHWSKAFEQKREI